MPLEINEIGVELAPGEGAPGPAGAKQPAPAPAASSPGRVQQLVNACVQRVQNALRLLKVR